MDLVTQKETNARSGLNMRTFTRQDMTSLVVALSVALTSTIAWTYLRKLDKKPRPVAQVSVVHAEEFVPLPAQVPATEAPVSSPEPVQTVESAPVVNTPPEAQEPVVAPVTHESLMAAAGIAPSDYQYVEYIVGHENVAWNPTEPNSEGSGAYGLCQAKPGSKMASAGADWATNPVTQLKWCNGYAVARYGSWANAYDHWVSHNSW